MIAKSDCKSDTSFSRISNLTVNLTTNPAGSYMCDFRSSWTDLSNLAVRLAIRFNIKLVSSSTGLRRLSATSGIWTNKVTDPTLHYWSSKKKTRGSRRVAAIWLCCAVLGNGFEAFSSRYYCGIRVTSFSSVSVLSARRRRALSTSVQYGVTSFVQQQDLSSTTT